MKRIYLLLALLCPLLTFAQTYALEDVTEDTLQTVGEILENVDLTQVPHGMLLDKTFPWVDATAYDGVHLNADNLIDFDTFGYLYATVFGAAVDLASEPPLPAAYVNAAAAYQTGGTLKFALARFGYGSFKPTAIADNLLDTLNRRIYDVPNRPASPYDVRETFFASPVATRAVGPNVTFEFDANLVFSNGTATVTNLSVDFGNGNACDRVIIYGSYFSTRPDCK